MNVIPILGQSNAYRFWTEARTGLTPASGTYMWDMANGGWVTPVNSLIVFCNALKAATQKEVRVIPAAGAYTLLPHGIDYWLDKASTTSPLVRMLNALTACGGSISACWFVGTEAEASVGDSGESITSALVELQAIIAGKVGRKPADLPFMVSPLGNATNYYGANGVTARNATLAAAKYPGMMLGPDHMDLEPDSSGIHLTPAAQDAFGLRAAVALTPIVGIGSAPPPSGQTYSGSFTRDCTLASGTQTISGLPFTPASVAFAMTYPASPAQSTGTDNGTAPSCSYTTYEGGTGTRTDSSVYMIATSSGNGYKGRISAFPANGFTMDWTRIASCGGTMTISYTAFSA